MVERYSGCLTGAAWPSSECQNAPLSHLYFSALRVFCNNLNLWTCSGTTLPFPSTVIFSHIPLRCRSNKGHDSLKCYTCSACSSHLLCCWSTFISSETQLHSHSSLNSWLLLALKSFQWVILFRIWPWVGWLDLKCSLRVSTFTIVIWYHLENALWLSIWMNAIGFTFVTEYKTKTKKRIKHPFWICC